MTFDKVIDPAIFSGRNNPGDVVPAIPDGVVLVTELPRKPYWVPRLIIECPHNGEIYYSAVYLGDVQQRARSCIDLDTTLLRFALQDLVKNVDTPELIDFFRDVCFWNPKA